MGSLIITAAAQIAAGFLIKSFQQLPDFPEEPAKAVSPPANVALNVSAAPGGPCIGVFGNRRVGGRVVLSKKIGTITYIVIVVANSPVASINGTYINNLLVSINAGSGVVENTPWKFGAFQSIFVKYYNGAQTVVDPDIAAAMPQTWTNKYIGYGTAYVVLRVSPDAISQVTDTFGGGLPDFTFDVSGFACYDPRNGAHNIAVPSTWTYTNNAALIHANYLIHDLGCRLPTSLVDWTSVTTAANVCDEAVTLKSGGTEPRYSASVRWQTDERHEDVLERIKTAHAGEHIPPGSKFRIMSGSFPATTFSVVPDEYVGGGLGWSDDAPLSQRVNGVRGKFISPTNNFESRDFPPWQDAAALSADGREQWLDLDLSCVVSHTQAQRLAKIAYNRARFGTPARAALTLKHFNIIAGDTGTITDALAGYSGKSFRVIQDRLTADMTVEVDLRAEDASTFAWTAATDEKDTLAALSVTTPRLVAVQPENTRGGGAVIDTAAAAGTIIPEIVFYPPPGSSEYDVVEVLNSAATGDGNIVWTGAASSVQSAMGTSYASGATLPARWVRYKNTGETDPSSSLKARGVSTQIMFADLASTIDGKTAANTPRFHIGSAPPPVIVRKSPGSVDLLLRASACPRVDQLKLYINTTNTPNIAGSLNTGTLVTTIAGNADAVITLTGTINTAQYYFLQYVDSVSAQTTNLSDAVLVVF